MEHFPKPEEARGGGLDRVPEEREREALRRDPASQERLWRRLGAAFRVERSRRRDVFAVVVRRVFPFLEGSVEQADAESVLEAGRLAGSGQPFDIVYFPRASTPEFCVKAAAVRASRIGWCTGMRFKMAFETEDSPHISWFMGTVSSIQCADPLRWPDSPWRLLQVSFLFVLFPAVFFPSHERFIDEVLHHHRCSWDEPILLQNVKRRTDIFFSLLLFFLSLSPSLPHILPRLHVSLSLSLSRWKFPSRGEISFSLFFSSFSHPPILFLTFFLACASLSLSRRKFPSPRGEIFFLSSSLLSLTLSFSSSHSSSPARLSLSLS